MKHYYFVDFENVADAGLEGFFQLSAEDTVYLFYSAKSNRINIDFIQKLLDGQGQATLRFLSVVSGNQALDLPLASLLGSLVASSSGDCLYTIVSRDKGFACLRSFWSTHAGQVTIDQVSRIADACGEKPAAPKAEAAEPRREPAEPKHAGPEAKHAEAAKAVDAPEAKPAAQAPAAQEEQNSPAAQAEPLPQAAEASAAPAQPAEKIAAPEQSAEQPPKEKKSLPQGRKPQSNGDNQVGKAKQALNTAVQQALSKAKFESRIISQVASLVTRSYGDKKIRQTVYREIIKQFGQKQGLEIYNNIKPLL